MCFLIPLEMCKVGFLCVLEIHLLMVLPLNGEDSLFNLFALPVKSNITLRLCEVRGMTACNGLCDGRHLTKDFFFFNVKAVTLLVTNAF